MFPSDFLAQRPAARGLAGWLRSTIRAWRHARSQPEDHLPWLSLGERIGAKLDVDRSQLAGRGDLATSVGVEASSGRRVDSLIVAGHEPGVLTTREATAAAEAWLPIGKRCCGSGRGGHRGAWPLSQRSIPPLRRGGGDGCAGRRDAQHPAFFTSHSAAVGCRRDELNELIRLVQLS